MKQLHEPPPTEKNEFRRFHDGMRRYRRRVFVDPKKNTRTPYRRAENPNEIKGKKNIRAAKRARVRLMKIIQANGQST